MNWWQVHAGLGSGNSPWYLFPSGWGSILIPPVLTGIIVLAGLWWHHQCHVGGCHWPARRKSAAGDPLCWRHMPHRELTHRELLARHHAALQSER